MLANILYVIIAILIVTTLYVVVRTLVFARRQRNMTAIVAVPVDDACVAQHLAEAVRCPTVPLDDRGTPDPEAFERLHRMLEETYPLVHRILEREVVSGYSLLYTWRGTQSELESVMVMAHQDVVSADPASLDQWTHPPFAGHVTNDFIWGRGTLDIKNQLIGIMEAAETLLSRGYQPERTILFGMGHDEETGGVNGCKVMGQLLRDRGIHLAGIVDEGGGIFDGLAAGVRGPVALVGVSEKGYLTVEITVQGQPGHSSTPPPQTAIGILAGALARLETHPFPTRIRRLRPMYHGIGRAAPIYLQVAFANVWLFGPFLRRWLTAIPEMNASIRTTTALTIVQGGVEDNTVPSEARAFVNFRLLPGDSIAEVLARATKVIDDERVTITPVPGKFNEALPISPARGPAYEGLKQVIREIFDNPPVAPYVMLGGTDCQHFVPVCDHIYRFTSLVMDERFRGLEHGIDERIPIDGMGKMVQFYARLFQAWGTPGMFTGQGEVS